MSGGADKRDDWYAQRRCVRKIKYLTYEGAHAVRLEIWLREPDPTLCVYRCWAGEIKVASAAHFHLGHANGRHERVLVKRAEKRRRRALWKAIQAGDLVVQDGRVSPNQGEA